MTDMSFRKTIRLKRISELCLFKIVTILKRIRNSRSQKLHSSMKGSRMERWFFSVDHFWCLLRKNYRGRVPKTPK